MQSGFNAIFGNDTMQVTSKWIDGMCFVGTAEGGHSVVMEGSAAEGAVKREQPFGNAAVGGGGLFEHRCGDDCRKTASESD